MAKQKLMYAQTKLIIEDYANLRQIIHFFSMSELTDKEKIQATNNFILDYFCKKRPKLMNKITKLGGVEIV